MLKVLIAAVLATAAASPTLANCYEDIGCDDSEVFSRSDLRDLDCDVLYEVRNAIYYQNGYCFKTERALDLFGDDECTVEEMADVRLNRFEKENVARISRVEKEFDCN